MGRSEVPLPPPDFIGALSRKDNRRVAAKRSVVPVWRLGLAVEEDVPDPSRGLAGSETRPCSVVRFLPRPALLTESLLIQLLVVPLQSGVVQLRPVDTPMEPIDEH